MSKIIEVWSRSQFCCDTNKAWSIVSKVVAHHEKLLTQWRYKYKWVNSAPIFFLQQLLRTTYGPQQFAKISVLKLTILFFQYFWCQNWDQWHKLSGKNTHIYFFFFWLKNQRVWVDLSLGRKNRPYILITNFEMT